MADPGINRDMRDMATHTRARVPALPMPDHALVVDDRVVITAAVDVPAAVVTAVVDVPVVMVTAAGITVTKNPLYCERATSDGWPFLRSAIFHGLAHFTVGVDKSAPDLGCHTVAMKCASSNRNSVPAMPSALP
jgi:hypothetical protein